MVKMELKKSLKDLLLQADITIDGNQPWDVHIKDDRFYAKVLGSGSLGLGESYMDGWWGCKAVDQFIFRVLKAKLDTKIKTSPHHLWTIFRAKIINLQKKSRAHIIGEEHYDKGNDLFENMLDQHMNYSCAYWKNVETLDEAQEAKSQLILKKLNLKPGMHILDIGCGWGGLANFLAKKANVKVTGITVSEEQVKYAEKHFGNKGVEIKFQDYRDLTEQFDRVVSVGMFEHVGCKNYRNFFKVALRCLKEDGFLLLHTIGRNTSVNCVEPWIAKYIFPNGMLPSGTQVSKAFEGLFQLEDWHNFGPYYDKTLMAWHRNFNTNWSNIKHQYDERFRRMWNYYLLSCAGGFRAKENRLWQIVLSKIDSTIEYESIR
jgi:cyclopropane-fatty-acyl-phospholipid synthase